MRWFLQLLLVTCVLQSAYIVASEEAETETVVETPAAEVVSAVAPAPVPVAAPVAVPTPGAQPVAPAPVVAAPATTPAVVEPVPVAAPVVEAVPVQQALPPEAQPSPRPAVVEELGEVVGIDTIDLSEPQGNWLFKRFWWEKAEKQYEKTKKSVDQVYEERMKFFEQRSDLDRKVFIPFYNLVGTEKGDITGTLNYLIDQLQTERSEEGLSQEQKQFYKSLEAEKKNLEQLKSDIKVVSKIDDALDTALIKLMELVNRARMYERQSWDSFKTITRELSDKKAFEQYSSMSNYITNINDILDYIRDSFAPHFAKLKTLANDQTEKVKASLKSLKEKGINLKSETKRLKKEREDSLRKPEPMEEETVEEPGFLGSTGIALSNAFGSIGSAIGRFVGYFATGIDKIKQSISSLWTRSETASSDDVAVSEELTPPEMQPSLPSEDESKKATEQSGTTETEEA